MRVKGPSRLANSFLYPSSAAVAQFLDDFFRTQGKTAVPSNQHIELGLVTWCWRPPTLQARLTVQIGSLTPINFPPF